MCMRYKYSYMNGNVSRSKGVFVVYMASCVTCNTV